MMNNTEFSSIIFDFDCTLTGIEGIDFLAGLHGVKEEVQALTEEALNASSMTAEIYEKRLQLIQPKRNDLTKLTQAYKKHIVEGVEDVCEILHSLDKSLYIINGGIRKAVVPVGTYLEIPPSHIHAVDVYFSLDGEYVGFDRKSVLVKPDGKSQIINTIAPDGPVAFIGDGANDLSAHTAVDRFVGFGGIRKRRAVLEASEFYVEVPDFKEVLPFILTPEELESIKTQQHNTAA